MHLGPSRLEGISDLEHLKQAIKKWKPGNPPYFDNLHGVGVIHLVRTQNCPKNYPLIRIRTCAYPGVRNVNFSENFAYVLNE